MNNSWNSLSLIFFAECPVTVVALSSEAASSMVGCANIENGGQNHQHHLIEECCFSRLRNPRCMTLITSELSTAVGFAQQPDRVFAIKGSSQSSLEPATTTKHSWQLSWKVQ
jgi:hypothetical protein